MITARTTRLVRVADLHGFRDAAVSLACGGTPFDTRDRLLVVPSRAAAAQLVRSIENRRLAADGALLLPDCITRDELHRRLAERLPDPAPVLTDAEREVLLGVACRLAIDEGAPPPFSLRPGLIAEILRFYDALQRNQKSVDAFERLALGMLEAGASEDRGAERLLRQTRFLVSAFRHFERRCEETGAADEHALTRLVMSTASARPWRHIVLTVGDRASDPQGLFPMDWDVLARVPGLERLDILATDSRVAGAFHERIHQLLPGIEEVRFESGVERCPPVLLIPPGGGLTRTARDREEEVGDFARWVRHAAGRGELQDLDRAALIVHRPLPYVYLARERLRAAGIPCQMFDALPLAAEPYAAALDLVFSFIGGGFARGPAVALLRSPHFRFATTQGDVRTLDVALSQAGYLGELETLERIPLTAARVLGDIARELLPLRSDAPCAEHLGVLLTFLTRHQAFPSEDDPLRERQLRARSAILGMLSGLRDAYARFDPQPVAFDRVAALARRWIEVQTFAPRTGDSGVHLVDAASAPFGDFDVVQLAGLIDGEWPERPHRNVFYSPAMLRDLGWAAESERLDGARAAFRDLLRLPAVRVAVSTFTLESDAVVTASSLIDEVEASDLDALEYTPPAVRIFPEEALGLEPPDVEPLSAIGRQWAARRLETGAGDPQRFHGMTGSHRPPAFSLSALERYQDCPFKFFAADVLRLEETLEDEPALSPRARGRFIHEVFQRFFEQWDARGEPAITYDRLDDARAQFSEVAEAMLAGMPDAEASIERARLFGSAISMGMVDVVLGLEASRPVPVRERWLEYRLEGEFSLGVPGGRRIPLKGVADRIDLLEGGRLRVIDYKSGYPPNPKRALQVPVYALCAQERLAAHDGHPWTVDEAAYVAFSGKRALVPVIKAGAPDPNGILATARERVFAAVDGVGRGEFPPRPHDPMICNYCAYTSVCRKDYVGDE